MTIFLHDVNMCTCVGVCIPVRLFYHMVKECIYFPGSLESHKHLKVLLVNYLMIGEYKLYCVN